MENIYNKLCGGLYFIAEMSANHAGKLENALEIVREAAKAGADCVKIQTYTADTMTLDCDNEYFKIKGGLWDGYKLYDLYSEASTPYEWHKAIKDECEKCGVDFLSTPFDKTSVDFLASLNVEFYKIASFELTDIPLIKHIASKGKPIIMSCGMGTKQEIEQAINACKQMGNSQIVLLKCCSEYPANFEDMKLATIEDMKKSFNLPVGLSDHSMGAIGAVVGASLGACVIEKHICISRKIKNPDSEFSMEIQEYADMVKDAKNALKIKGSVSYDRTKKEQDSTVFRRSIFASTEIKKGEKFSEQNTKIIRPSTGLSPKHYKQLLGKTAKRDIAFGTPILTEDL